MLEIICLCLYSPIGNLLHCLSRSKSRRLRVLRNLSSKEILKFYYDNYWVQHDLTRNSTIKVLFAKEIEQRHRLIMKFLALILF